MKAFYFREEEYEKYLIPAEEIEDFDKLCDAISNEENDDAATELYAKFNELYHGKYKCEGELYDTKLFIEDNNL